MFSAIFFLSGMAVIFAIAIVAIVVYGIVQIFAHTPEIPPTGATRSRAIQH